MSRGRHAEIDVAKGLALLGVLLIHAEATGASFVFRTIVNRAVPVFVVLFGVNAALWWRGRALPGDLGAWYAGRAQRILVPVWAVLPVWWAMALWLRPPGVELSPGLLLLHAVGWLQGIGTGWFVTMILQLVVFYPVLESLRRRWGMGPLVTLAGAAVVFAQFRAWWLVWRLGWWGARVLALRFVPHVVFGTWLAGRLGRLGPGAGLAGVGAWGLGLAAERTGWLVGAVATPVVDCGLATAVLVAARGVLGLGVSLEPLAWMGRRSYGLYLGQLLVHNAFVFVFGIAGLYALMPSWAYASVLLVGAVVLVWVGDAVASALQTDRRAWAR